MAPGTAAGRCRRRRRTRKAFAAGRLAGREEARFASALKDAERIYAAFAQAPFRRGFSWTRRSGSLHLELASGTHAVLSRIRGAPMVVPMMPRLVCPPKPDHRDEPLRRRRGNATEHIVLPEHGARAEETSSG